MNKLLILILLATTLSCAPPQPTVEPTIDYPGTISTLVWIQVNNQRVDAIHITALWNDLRQILGTVEGGSAFEFSVTIDQDTAMALELRFENDYRCRIPEIPARVGEVLHLTMSEELVTESFCVPVRRLDL